MQEKRRSSPLGARTRRWPTLPRSPSLGANFANKDHRSENGPCGYATVPEPQRCMRCVWWTDRKGFSILRPSMGRGLAWDPNLLRRSTDRRGEGISPATLPPKGCNQKICSIGRRLGL